MIANTLAVILAAASAVVALPFGGSPSPNCPPKGFDALPTLNVTAYAGRWYCQSQAPVTYAGVNENFCVTATYTLKTDGSLDVFNYDNKDKVNGTPNKVHLNGNFVSPSQPSKLRVTFPAFPNFGGDYWVMKTGPINANGQYDWAIISGGNATASSGKDGKCIAPNNAGLWMFTREPVVAKSLSDSLTQEILGLGLDASAMNPIVQEGCLYE
ncbi:hypothetical protein HDU76_003837, partial [Blyttiomyces sp. JEL0837]